MKILIIGNGYVGSRCAQEWSDAVVSDKIINTVEDVLELLDQHQPTAVLNAAGVVGKPNVDWCEDHALETMKGNAVLPMIIAEACAQRNIYLLHIGSGCIFYGPSPDPKGWLESDIPNPSVVYSKSKYAGDLMLQTLSNVGIARIRMPMDSVPSAGNIIDKLASYSKIIDVKNSLTVLDDMIVAFHGLLEKKATGIFHVTNPGTISHRQIVEWYKELVDPTKTNEWISEDDLVDQSLAVKKRSTNKLQSPNLDAIGLTMPPAHEAVRRTMEKYAELKKQL